MTTHGCRTRWTTALAISLAGPAFALAAPPGVLQPQVNPVYVDDSPIAADVFIRVREHVAGGNADEAVRVLQLLLDEQAERLVTSTEPDLFVSVRAGVRDLLLATPALLERYRETFGPRAQRLLGEGRIELVERTLLMTPAGFDAVLRLAQSALEDARFEHARLLLEQLARHPDRKDDRAKQSAAMMVLLARYLDRPEVTAAARQWSTDAADPAPAGAPFDWPAAAKIKPLTPLAATGLTRTDGMVSKPLWTVALAPGAAPPEANLGPGTRGQVSVPMYARELLLLPTVSGDTIYLTDGAQIAAWDRFTLAPRWAITPGIGDAPIPEHGIRGDRRRIQRMEFGGNPGRNDDMCTVAIGGSGRFVVAATGRAFTNARSDGDDRVQALDATTGRPRWSVVLNTLEPPALYDATVRGPIHVVENTVVFAARKHLPDRRLVSLSLVGLDLPTGKLQWIRPIGSAGSMPWVLQSMGADGAVVADGVVFRADRLGVVGAIDAGTGRVRWIRRLGVDTSSSSDQPKPWEMGIPVVDGGSIICIAPDMKRIVRIDRATGKILGQRDVADLGAAQPRYLLRVGDFLACIGEDRIAFLSAARFESDKAVLAPAIPVPGIRGRSVVTAVDASASAPAVGGGGVDRLLVPTVNGFTLIDPARAADESALAGSLLEDSGNVLPLDSQIIVVDDLRLHSYLQWDVAEGLLTKRIQADPKDPGPAATFAELAYRAGKPERIAGAVRQAMSALKLGPQNDATWNARARLIDAMQGMLAAALEPAAPGAPVRHHLGVKPITDRALLADLVDLLGELSFQPEDRLAHTLAVGRLSELNTQPESAVGAYQKVLLEPALAGATWRGPQVSIRGELEAARRIESLLRQHGPQAYAAQEQAAATELSALGAQPTEPQLEAVAARFPLSTQTPAIWQRIADIRTAENRPQPATAALEAGLRSATRQPEPPPAVVGEIAGRLIVGLRERQQVAAAAGVLRAVRARFPAIALTSAGQPLDAQRVGAELASRLAASMRWPRVGAIRSEGAQAIAGWQIMDPLLSDRTPNVSALLPLMSDDEVALWTSPTTAADKRDPLTKAWSAPLPENTRAHLIKTTTDSAYFALIKESDGYIVKAGGTPLQTRWKSEPLGKIFGAPDPRTPRTVPGVNPGFPVPAEGETQPTNLIVTLDERTLVLVQRAGRAAAFDTDTGELLWSTRLGVGRVYDADISSGTLAVAGDQETFDGRGAVVDLKPVIAIVDARTGRVAQRINDFVGAGAGAAGVGGVGGVGGSGGHIRWVGFADSGALITALDSAVVSLDPASGQPNWTISHPDAMPVSAMWIFGDQLVMADQNRGLWLATIPTGRLRQTSLEMPRTHMDLSQTLDAFPLAAVPGTGFGVATQQGMALFGPDGALSGVDGMDGAASMTRPKPAEGRAVTIETIADGRTNDGLMYFSLKSFDLGPAGGALLDDRQVLLGARPSALTLLDGKVAITAGVVTVIYQAPASPQ